MQNRSGFAHERKTSTISETLLLAKTTHHVLVMNKHLIHPQLCIMLAMYSSLSNLVFTITEYLHRIALPLLVYRLMEPTPNPLGRRGRRSVVAVCAPSALPFLTRAHSCEPKECPKDILFLDRV